MVDALCKTYLCEIHRRHCSTTFPLCDSVTNKGCKNDDEGLLGKYWLYKINLLLYASFFDHPNTSKVKKLCNFCFCVNSSLLTPSLLLRELFTCVHIPGSVKRSKSSRQNIRFI